MERLTERPTTVQDVIADGSCQQHHGDALTQAQRELIIYMYGEDALTAGTFTGEREDLLRLAAKLQTIFREQWTVFNAAERLTVHSCQLVFGDLQPSEQARQALQDYAESYLEDLSTIFAGDGQMRPAFKPTGRVS